MDAYIGLLKGKRELESDQEWIFLTIGAVGSECAGCALWISTVPTDSIAANVAIAVLTICILSFYMYVIQVDESWCLQSEKRMVTRAESWNSRLAKRRDKYLCESNRSILQACIRGYPMLHLQSPVFYKRFLTKCYRRDRHIRNGLQKCLALSPLVDLVWLYHHTDS